MKRLKIKINFECTHANKKETEMELEKIIHYHIYEKIWNNQTRYLDKMRSIVYLVFRKKNKNKKGE